ncbi:MAG TPA: hypothetical protein VGZ00_05600 [Candidatus Baltobacteraceae bacterium]|nr:hypothetical protein [Candidatus Baltobacteraceae bacterium]
MDVHLIPVWDGTLGTAGGPSFGRAFQELVSDRELKLEELASAANFAPDMLRETFEGRMRLTLPQLARLIAALRMKVIDFMQKTGMLSLEVYAAGLDPLYFLPDGQIRYDARIYMREINPRHQVPERDMLVRNPTLAALMADQVLDPLGKIEIELAYLLRAAVQKTGGRL